VKKTADIALHPHLHEAGYTPPKKYISYIKWEKEGSPKLFLNNFI
jgi:hypothetical protein